MESFEPEIEVVMATWNGARYVEEQLESLFGQTFQNFRLVVRDDGSADSTLQVVERYRSQYPGRVVIRNNPDRLGALGSFSMLALESAAPYVAFCDQDDIWRNDKLQLSLNAMKRLEKEHGCNTPLLVFSDMTLVDEQKNILSASLWKLGHINPVRGNLGAMLAQNLVTGCTAMANRSLIVKGSPIPKDAAMHDAWLGLVAVVFGFLCPLNEATVWYRQHDANAVGAGRGWRSGNLLKRLRNDQPFRERIEASRRQAEAFVRQYGDQLNHQQRRTLTAWSNSRDLPAFVRQFTLHRQGLRGTSWFNHLGFLARI